MKKILTDTNDYSFYETPDWVSETIAKELYKYNIPKFVIDMGAGNGSLQQIYTAQNKNIKLHSIEINSDHYNRLKKIKSNIHSINLLKNPIKSSKSNIPCSNKGVIISNPPYGNIELSNKLRKLLKKHDLLDNNSKAKYTRKEIVFIARALEHMESGSDIVFLVPKMILTGKNTKKLRETLFKQHNLHKAIMLPEGTFCGTEIQTILLFFKKNAGCSKRLVIESVLKNASTRHVIKDISDIDNIISKKITLKSLTPSYSRGKSSAKSLRDRSIPHLHSSDLASCHKNKIKLPSINHKTQGERIATAGDILISRVGTRCLGKVIVLEAGSSVISDCVIRIKVPARSRNKIFKKLISDDVQNWLQTNASGSCAKLLSYNILNNLPI